MKKIIPLLLFVLMTVSCDYDESQVTSYTINNPEVMDKEALRSSVKITSGTKEFSNYGQVIAYKDHLYISDPGKGIYIINNEYPIKSYMVSYIEVMGNYDFAVKDGKLYAEVLTDLVWFDISNPKAPALGGRLNDVFPNNNHVPLDNKFDCDFGDVKDNEVIIGWRLETIENPSFNEEDLLSHKKGRQLVNKNKRINNFVSSFEIKGEYLFTASDGYLSVFYLSESPIKKAEKYIGKDVVGISGNKQNLFVHIPGELLVYSVENPLEPALCSKVSYVQSKNAITISDDIAYISILSEESLMEKRRSELLLVDVKNGYSPEVLTSFPMKNPKGLVASNGYLFLCDDGLKIFRRENSLSLGNNLLVHHKDIKANDVALNDNILLVATDDTILLYDWEQISELKLLFDIRMLNMR